MVSKIKFTGKVLVAEDNSLNQRLIELLLIHLKIDFKIVKNGRECCEEILQDEYPVVFMDLNMPVMDGYEASRIIRNSLSKESQPYIIAVTATNIDLATCQRAGIDDYVTKPIDLKKLRHLLNTLPQEAHNSA